MTLVILSLFVAIGAWAACDGAIDVWRQATRVISAWWDRVAETID